MATSNRPSEIGFTDQAMQYIVKNAEIAGRTPSDQLDRIIAFHMDLFLNIEQLKAYVASKETGYNLVYKNIYTDGIHVQIVIQAKPMLVTPDGRPLN